MKMQGWGTTTSCYRWLWESKSLQSEMSKAAVNPEGFDKELCLLYIIFPYDPSVWPPAAYSSNKSYLFHVVSSLWESGRRQRRGRRNTRTKETIIQLRVRSNKDINTQSSRSLCAVDSAAASMCFNDVKQTQKLLWGKQTACELTKPLVRLTGFHQGNAERLKRRREEDGGAEEGI